MKLLIFTNLDTYERAGLLPALGLTRKFRDSYAIKGIRAGEACDCISAPSEAASYDILLCHQFGVGIAKVTSLLDIDQDWAFVFHQSGGNKLWEVYNKMSQQAMDRKLIYRYEPSGEGLTFQLLRELCPLQTNKPFFEECLQNYMREFEDSALHHFIEDILRDIRISDGQAPLEACLKKQNVPYLWRVLFETHHTLPGLLKEYYNFDNTSESTMLFLEIRKLLTKNFK